MVYQGNFFKISINFDFLFNFNNIYRTDTTNLIETYRQIGVMKSGKYYLLLK